MADLVVIGQTPPSPKHPDTGEVGYKGIPGSYVAYTYENGAKELRFHPDYNPGGDGVLVSNLGIDPVIREKWLQRQNPAPKTPPAQTPDQQRAAQLENAKREADAAATAREEAEKKSNYDNPKPNPLTGEVRRYYETNQQRAAREATELQEVRQRDQDNRDRLTREQNERNEAERNRIAAGGLAVQQGSLQETIRQHQFDESKPTFLSQADDKTPNIVRYNPTTGQMESIQNPNYDKVKAEAEQIRQNLSTQIQAGTLQLEQAKQQYAQWFDTNVKTPLALAQEARDKAAEQRAALDAEERRRQFASTFSLQKGQLGQQAGQAAMQAEESLLPYRAGPDEAADMSSAINSLGAGGSMSTNAAAGINFKASDFEFNAPDFRSIAKKAAKDALSGISSYIPSDEKYSTADYSGVPAVNTGGAPSTPDVSSGLQGILSNLTSKYQYSAP